MGLFKKLSLVSLLLFVAHSGFAVLDHRAQSWKAHRVVGSSALSFDEIDYIVVPESNSVSFRAALTDLTELYVLRYGKEVSLIESREDKAPKRALSFERTEQAGQLGAFSILRDRTRVVIRSSEEAGWKNAVYAIANDMLGARWYWPGDLGFEWVDSVRPMFTYRPWRSSPAFLQRRLRPIGSDFSRRNRLNSVYSFNHNLANIFNSEVFEESPEAFATVNGRRKAPKGHAGTDPQPDLTNQRTVEIAAEAALEYFEEKPNATSYSLSINDNVLFDTTGSTEEAVSPLSYFRRRPNYSDLVFGFMNQVAERVFNEGGAWETPSGESRYLTALSYYWAEPVPSFQIHPRVMPVLTADRAQWHDPDFRSQDKALIAAWAKSGAERVATWDYYFGAPYIYPRQMNQWISESLRYMADSGVDVLYAQLPAFWGLDGAKTWLTAELLWDPSQNADELLDEYYDNFFGAASAPMREFYETAEQHRNENEGTAEWIKLYKDESCIALYTPSVLRDMRDHIDEAHALVIEDTRRSDRVAVVSGAFRLTELYAAYWAARRDLVISCLDGLPSAVLKRNLETFREAREGYQRYHSNFISNSEYAPNPRHISLSQSNPERIAEGLLAEPAGVFRSLLKNPNLRHQSYEMRNFLGPELPKLVDWHLDYRPSELLQTISSEHSVANDSGLRIEGADVVSVFNKFPALPDTEYELRLQGSWKVSLDNRVHLDVAWLDIDGNMIQSEIPIRLPIEHRADPVNLRVPLTAPTNTYDVRVRLVVSRQYPGDYLDISEFDLGDVN